MAGSASRDPGLQPERTLLSWRRTILTLIITDVLIWRAWLTASPGEAAARSEGLGIAAGVASLATVALTVCILSRALQLRGSAQAPPAILMKTTSAALLALAAAVVCSIIMSALPR
ncbi:hypothetical protein ARGLB_064_00500 [Arthrobacter globiformis NBRC 12137]|uniref:DUF202 domain-containing protein n=1 Tax=Arthrobacter globiformis (strain ATCC 8010 / DSM 20124 / JCM 1332 / NBRC 12137 / NCIMB 8907 / NRRL B-2979 / 168) TaxID=1077972 RepID=H0QN87_ARTG1|nr:DUF202 domain-containing protein [Arthrobacter globiformis]GAB14288.1 hypothetical protein ARGLB_064_00500 [Arthrobacter globiformis NBRC 12137]